MRIQIVGFTLGILLMILSGALLIPALLDYADGHSNANIFFISSLIAFFFGSLFYLVNRNFTDRVTVHQTFLLTTMSWLFMAVFSALPLYLSDLQISFTDAFFESMSGITTTGSTVLTGLDHMSRGILIWRALIEWIGGIGIVAFAITVLPSLRIGGMQLFRTESSDKSEKVMPKTGNLMVSLFKVYVGLTLLCAIAYKICGMTYFDAFAHALGTLPTAGFSTHDASFAFYDNYALDMAGAFFMFVGGLPFVLYIQLFIQGKFAFWRDEQFRFFTGMIAVIIAIMTVWLYVSNSMPFSESFRHVTFNVISVVTTTGFASTDYMLWGQFSLVAFLFLSYPGGCAGSTSGGIKTMRIILAMKAVGTQIKRLLYPQSVIVTKYQGKAVIPQDVQAILGFLCLYALSNILLTLALAFVGLDFVTAISSAASAIGNVGPGVGDIIGPAGSFKPLPDSAKWLMSLGMLLGRLEIMTVLVLLVPAFWRDSFMFRAGPSVK